MTYTIKEFRMIETARLTEHPDAQAWPSDDDDRAGLDASIACVGMLEPLTVIAGPGSGWLVIDGCGRLQDARKHSVAQVPCLVAECDEPRNFAAHKNAMGRKRSTGSRILCYLAANQEAVLAAAVADAPRRVSCDTHRLGGQEKLPADVRFWTGKEIARRLRVSNKDVVAAVHLLACQANGSDLDGLELTEERRDKLADVFQAVMCARTPVRRWKAAYGGKTVPADGSGKAATNYPALGVRSLTSLQTVFEHWHEMRAGQREILAQTLGLLLWSAPEEVRVEAAAKLAEAQAEQAARVPKGRKAKI